ncbi:MAG TPA: mannose-1-phosphate guanylyltransferase [Flavobacteriales bacterium]|nr:mannose-1-phosphate guanylyltransferase [Flavobacteriales bacterium]HIO67463.1 mannose-1-phosphate guanylyltransferase [Flavobacteriales bacterium]
MKNNYCIIMAGGIGSRFWPMSTSEKPKQFLDILGVGRTLIQHTYDRFANICPKENVYVVTNEAYKDLIIEQLQINPEQVIAEPLRRNTAPCIAYASFKIAQINPEANLIVAPSDHLILDQPGYENVIELALNQAMKEDCLITLGIKPSRPDTGYGYIQFTDANKDENGRIKKVKTFTEKPDLELAKEFLASGDFYWNGGIFVWTARSIMNALEGLLPEVYNLFKKGEGKYNTAEELDFIADTYERCKNISIDYGVMEKAENVYVVLSDFGWSDLGTWGSLYDSLPKQEDGNAVIGKKVFMYESKNCIVNMPEDKLVILQGLDDYIVVESNDTLLVCKKSDEQKIREMVNDVNGNV